MDRLMKRILTAILIIAAGLAVAQVPGPAKFLGFEVGTDRKVADAKEITDYFWKLDRTSPRITVKEVGKTTEGRPFIVAFITSETNHAKLESYREIQQLLADPRKISDTKAEELISRGKTIVMINCSLHASEIGASQMAMQLACDLATQNTDDIKRILDNVILLLIPLHNPDGVQMVVDWYEKHLGTDYEGCRMPWLYNTYVGHDNNRDWYMFTQKETQLTIQVHNAWHPQIIVDMHQMGSTGARLFVPPYIDPFEPNIDPILQQHVSMMGTYIAGFLTTRGLGGVEHSSGFDAWTPARAYHHYHGGVRILTEAASVKLATPINVKWDELRESVRQSSVKMPLVWPGGDWRLKDIVDYDYAAAMAALTHAAGLRKSWLRGFYQVHKKAVNRKESPYAYIIPANQRDIATAVKMLRILQMGGVEIHRAEADFKSGGRSCPKGSYIIKMAQPYGGFAKTLLEDQVYPEIRETPDGPLKRPYDVVAHTLPRLMGVKRFAVNGPVNVKSVQLKTIESPAGKVDVRPNAYGYVWSHTTNDDMVALNRLVKAGHTVHWLADAVEDGSATYPAGTMLVRQKGGLEEAMRSIAGDLCVHFRPISDKPESGAYALKPVRLGLYKSWTASMDEGWTRWVLEQYAFPYVSIFDADIRKGDLKSKIDVLIIPDLRERAIVEGVSEKDIPPEYAGGIGEAGVLHLSDFIRQGGTVITLNNAADFAIHRFGLNVADVTDGVNRKEFFIPGSILKVMNNARHPVAYGYDRDSDIFFRNSPAFQLGEGASVVTYPVFDPLMSGWATGSEHLYGKTAIADVPLGQGKVILIGFPAQYRGQSHGSFRYLFNAIYYGPAEKERL